MKKVKSKSRNSLIISKGGLKVFKVAIIFLILLVLEKQVNAQIPDTATNYFTITAQQDAYYDSLLLIRNADSMEGTGYKQYLRWNNFNWPRIDSTGLLTNYVEAINNYFDTPSKTVSSNVDWTYSGPFDLPTNFSTGIGKGWVNRILVDPENPNIIYAGTHNSGVWKTINGGIDWYNTSEKVPQINGIASMFQSKDADKTIYIATATNITSYSNGIYKYKPNESNPHWEYVPVKVDNIDIFPFTGYNEIPTKIIEHPTDTDIIFLLTKASIYKTTDKGLTWTRVFHEAGIQTYDKQWYNDLVFNGANPDIMYLGGYKIFKSINGGDTWTDDITLDVSQDKDNVGFCRIFSHENIDTQDEAYGDVWFFFSKLKTIVGEEKVVDCITKTEYPSLNSYNYLIDDINNIGAGGNKNAFIVDPDDENRFIIAGLQIKVIQNDPNSVNYVINNISRPNNPPGSIADNILHDDIRDIYYYKTSHDNLIVACDGGVSEGYMEGYNVDQTEDWEFHDISVIGNDRTTYLNINEVFALNTSKITGEITFNCQDVGGYKLKEENIIRTTGGDGGAILFDNTNPSNYYHIDNQWNLFTKRDRNNDEIFGKFLTPGGKKKYFYSPIVQLAGNPNILYTGGTYIYKFTDVQNSEEATEIKDFVGLDDSDCDKASKPVVTDIEYDKNNNDVIYLSSTKDYSWSAYDGECNDQPPLKEYYENAFKKSVDGGMTWVDLSPNLNGLTRGYITDIEINPKNSNELWLCFGFATGNSDPEITKKVYKSTDGGLSFTAFSQGIPPAIPVWEMEYDSYTDMLYVATDLGVFSRPADGSSNWVDITSNNGSYPVIMVTDIEINYKNRKLYAGTFGRGIWETSLEDCPEYDGINDVVITGSVEWNEPHSINTNLIINPGATLTIKDAVYFNSKSRFIIREGENGTEGGHLILDGAVLTNSCDGVSWKGIEVWGNGYEDQNPLYQGWITMKNNSVISNAHVGILANNTDYPNAAFNYHGGIVHLSNSTFINNIVSVQLEDYHHQTFNQINNCKFITDENWAHYGASPDRFISYSNYGFETNENGRSYKQEVKGCSFENFRYADQITQSDKWGKGIYAFNTRLVVDDLEIQDGLNTWYKHCTFKHLYVGIEAMGSENMLPVIVSNSEFNKNKEGINLYNLYNSEITLNDFDVLETYNAHGLYLYYCPSGYQIEANNFWSDNNAATNYGLIIHNSGENINLVYNNSFSNLNYASTFQEVNRIISGSREGLVVKCNTYSNNIYDIYVDGTKGIAFDQGSYNPQTSADLAGNIFSDASSIPDHYDILNQSSTINYNHHNQIGQTLKVKPIQYTALTVFPYEFSQFPYSQTESCPPTIDIGGGGTDIKTEMLLVNQSADSTLSIINDLEDGGDTYELYFNTETAMQGEEIETRDMLISESPYLSDSVMLSAIENETILPNAIVRDVLIENPQAAKSDVVQSALDNKTNSMPDYMRNEINQGLDTMSVLEIKYSQLAALRLKEELYFNKLQKLYIQDSSISFLTDSLSVLYDLKGGLNNKYKKAMLYLSLNDTLSADTIIENIQLNFNLSSSQEDERQSYEDYFDVKKRMLSEGLSFPDSISIVELHEIHNTGTGNPVILSATLLEHINEINTVLPHYQADTSTLKKGGLTNLSFDENNKKQKTKYLLLKPNPAGNYFIAEYKLSDNMSESSISITSIDGINKKTVSLHSIVDELVIETTGLNSGVYIVNLQSNGSIIESKKLTIVK